MEITAFAARVAQLYQRKQVIIGDAPVSNLVRNGNAGLVWLTVDLNGTKSRRLQRLCEKYGVPCVVAGDSGELSELSGFENTRVCALRRSCSGLRAILLDLPENEL